MAQRLSGGPVAKQILQSLSARIAVLQERGVTPAIALVRVGANSGDVWYESSVLKRCADLGIRGVTVTRPVTISESAFLAEIDQLNRDPAIHGVLIFMPLPQHISREAVCRLLLPSKDIDGITDGSIATVVKGAGAGFAPCTAEACVEILDHYQFTMTGKRVAVLGRSMVIGKPVSLLLLNRNATVTVCHSKTKALSTVLREADILISAAGKAGIITSEMVQQNQVILDVGTNLASDGSMCGDVDYEAVEPLVSALTPVPGGVGSVTTAVLLRHVVDAAERSLVE